MGDDRGNAGSPRRGPVVLGVRPRQSPEAQDTALSLAAGLGLELVCGFVLSGAGLSEWNTAAGIDYSALHADEREELGDAEVEDLRIRLELALGGTGVRWSLRILIGDPARALGGLAADLGACVLVVGAHSRKPRGFHRGGLQHSTVGHLLAARRIPVLVVPPARATPRFTTLMDP
ncbi:universal stress protein [Paeniglutamicibacter sp. R2-26]|uniref:universal stress protein n=1 Tax=Paeniglutamicibacter sp. R2-26 TaxID=3144417 RepID=UPI003EE7F7D0